MKNLTLNFKKCQGKTSGKNKWKEVWGSPMFPHQLLEASLPHAWNCEIKAGVPGKEESRSGVEMFSLSCFLLCQPNRANLKVFLQYFPASKAGPTWRNYSKKLSSSPACGQATLLPTAQHSCGCTPEPAPYAFNTFVTKRVVSWSVPEGAHAAQNGCHTPTGGSSQNLIATAAFSFRTGQVIEWT